MGRAFLVAVTSHENDHDKNCNIPSQIEPSPYHFYLFSFWYTVEPNIYRPDMRRLSRQYILPSIRFSQIRFLSSSLMLSMHFYDDGILTNFDLVR